MSKPLDDDPPDTEPVSNVLNQELGRALDREEARRLEDRLLADEELRAATARKTAVPSNKATKDSRAPEVESATTAPAKNLFGGTVRGVPAQPKKLDAEGSVPESWAGARPERLPKKPIATPDANTSISEPKRPATAPKPRRPAAAAVAPPLPKPQSRRFLYLAGLLVVVPVTLLLIARAIDPKPVFSAKPPRATVTANSRPVSDATPPATATATAAATTDAATTAALPPVGIESTTTPATPQATPVIPVAPPRALPPDKTTPIPTALPSVTQSSTSGVEPFFKRTGVDRVHEVDGVQGGPRSDFGTK